MSSGLSMCLHAAQLASAGLFQCGTCLSAGPCIFMGSSDRGGSSGDTGGPGEAEAGVCVRRARRSVSRFQTSEFF